MTICMIVAPVYATDSQDKLDKAFLEYIENPYHEMIWVEEKPDSIYDLSLIKKYCTSNGKTIFFATPKVMMVQPAFCEYKIGQEIFKFNNIGYYPFFLVFDGDKIYHIEQAYEENIINDWDLREYALSTNFRDASYADLNKKEWYYTIVEKCIYNQYMGATGLINQDGSKCFEPDLPISRAMVTTILYRMNQTPQVEYKAVYKDVKDQLWYSNAIAWATENKVVSGYQDGTFAPDENITRQDFSIMLRNYAKKMGLDTEVSINFDTFKDGNDVDSYASSAMAWCVKVGLISGSTQENGTYLRPKADTTRAECAKMISLLQDKIKYTK